MLEGKLIIIPALGHQNKGKSSFTGSGLFVLVPCFILNDTRQVSESAVILLCLYLPGQRESRHDVCVVTIPIWRQEL